MLKWLKRNFGRNWWATQHICSDVWFPCQFRSLFGVPLTTMFFKVAGPFESKARAADWVAYNFPEQDEWYGAEDDSIW